MTGFWIFIFCAWTGFGAMALVLFGDFLSPETDAKRTPSILTVLVYVLPIIITMMSLDGQLKELQTKCIVVGVAKLVPGAHQFQAVKFEFVGIPHTTPTSTAPTQIAPTQKGPDNATTASDSRRLAEQGPGPAFD